MELTLKKYTGLGNDYLIFDPNKGEGALTDALVQLACSRNFGVGADGILIGPLFNNGCIGVRIFNPDGSEAAGGGNALMIFARYLRDEGYAFGPRVTICTGRRQVEAEFLDARAETLRVHLGKVSFHSGDVPVTGAPREVVNEPMVFSGRALEVTCLTTGIPHCIVPLESVSRELACGLGGRIVSAAQFPEQVNVSLVQVLDRANLAVETFERGAGYTLPSGSGAAAAAAAMHRLGRSGAEVTVHMPGGTMSAQVGDDGGVSIVGYVRAVCTAAWSAGEINRQMGVV